MRFLLAFVFLSLNAFSAEEIFMPCLTGPVRTISGYKTYEAQIISGPTGTGIQKLKIIANERLNRKVVTTLAVEYKDKGGSVSAIMDRDSGKEMVVYKERMAPTRVGSLYIKELKGYVSTLCFADF